jgi:hypothetical protein
MSLTATLQAYRTKTIVLGSPSFSDSVQNKVRLHEQDFIYIQITFSADTTFTAANVTTTNCTVSEFTAEVGSTVYSFKLTSDSALGRDECFMSVDMSALQDVLNNVGTGFLNFEFIHDTLAQILFVTLPGQTTGEYVGLPANHSITPSSRQKEVTSTHVEPRPSGYTPWTHRDTFTFDGLDSTSGVREINTVARAASERKDIVLKEAIRRLEETDWMVLSDQTTPTGIAQYRSDLRTVIGAFDIQGTPPASVTFPSVPNASGTGSQEYPGELKQYSRG